jgi:hypothetical protein
MTRMTRIFKMGGARHSVRAVVDLWVSGGQRTARLTIRKIRVIRGSR